MQSTLMPSDAVGWSEILAGISHDFFHLPDYLRLSAVHERGEAMVFIARQDQSIFLVPLVVREIDGIPGESSECLWDATSPYGYSSPLFQNADANFARLALQGFLEALRGRRVVSCFLRLHPLIRVPLEVLESAGQVVLHGRTVSVDLTLSEGDMDRQIRRSHRRDLRKAAGMNYVVCHDRDWHDFDAFFDIYHSLMRRLNARAFYRFSREYFEGLRHGLRDAIHLFTVRQHGTVAGASLYTECQGVVTPFLGGTAEEHVPNGPPKLVERFVCSWAKARGNRVFHLGGGLGGKEDSLFEFKAGFSPLRHPYHTWHVVSDPATYQALVQRKSPSTIGSDPHGFFPAYRRPI